MRRQIKIFETPAGQLDCPNCAGAGAFELSNPKDYGATSSWRDCLECDGAGTVRCAECRRPATVFRPNQEPACAACAAELAPRRRKARA